MTSLYIYTFITSMVFTISVETVLLAFLIIFILKKVQYSIKDLVSAGVFASAMTIPYVWFVFPHITNWSKQDSLMVSEPIIATIEAIFYSLYLKLNIKESVMISIFCNLTSFLLGPVLRAQGLWIFW